MRQTTIRRVGKDYVCRGEAYVYPDKKMVSYCNEYIIYGEFLEGRLKKVMNKKDIVIHPQYRWSNKFQEPSEKADLLCIIQSINFQHGTKSFVDNSKTTKLKVKLLQKVKKC